MAIIQIIESSKRNLIIFLVSYCLLLSLITYGIYSITKVEKKPLIDNVNNPIDEEKEEEKKEEGNKQPQEEENKKEEPIKINTEPDFIEINRRLDYILLFILINCIAYVLMAIVASWYLGRICESVIEPYYNRQTSEQLFDSLYPLDRAEFVECWDAIKPIKDNKVLQFSFVKINADKLGEYTVNTQDVILSLYFHHQIKTKQLQSQAFCLTRNFKSELTALMHEKIAKLPLVTVLLWPSIIVSLLSIFLSYFLYFIMKSFWQVGFRKTVHNFTWSDIFSVYKVFYNNSKLLGVIWLLVICRVASMTAYRSANNTLPNVVQKHFSKFADFAIQGQPKITDQTLIDFVAAINIDELIYEQHIQMKEQQPKDFS